MSKLEELADAVRAARINCEAAMRANADAVEVMQRTRREVADAQRALSEAQGNLIRESGGVVFEGEA